MDRSIFISILTPLLITGCADDASSDTQLFASSTDPAPEDMTGSSGDPDGAEIIKNVAVPANPFGSHLFKYASGSVLPALSQSKLDSATASFYDTWKDQHLVAGCGSGRYYVHAETESGNKTVSEAHGYGMMISAIMAGHDPDAKAHFDGLYRYFRDHQSANSANLMAWYQNDSCKNAEGPSSATDGDLDIAFALLLADKQWGSCGKINYKAQALKVIGAIANKELDDSGSYVLLGDWVDPSSSKYYKATRSSDFITDHFRSFAAASGKALWTDLLDDTYTLISTIRTKHSPKTGLLPDFIVSPLHSPAPAAANFLEGSGDGAHSYNACRDPWRLATDFLVSGDSRPKAAAKAMTAWIKGATGGDPKKIRAGYKLDGTPNKGSDYLTMAFVAPFGPAAMVDSSHQAWLTSIWKTTVATGSEGYYEDTIKLLAMIVMSGNWWAPEARPAVCNP